MAKETKVDQLKRNNFTANGMSAHSVQADSCDTLNVTSVPDAKKTDRPRCSPSLIRRIFSGEGKTAAKKLLRLGGPVVISLMNSSVIGLQAVLFCGHLGAVQLDAAALAISFTNITGYALIIGLCSACDTLFSQAYGSVNKKKVGVYLQQSVLMLGLLVLPFGALWINMELIMLLTGQNADVSRLAGEFATILLVALLPQTFYQLLARYLQSQGITRPVVFFGLLANITQALINYVLIFVFDFGVRGAAWGYVVAFFTLFISILIYIIKRKIYKETWDGWSWDSLREWGQFASLAVPGMLMICAEWWCFEAILLVSGIIGKIPLAVTAIVFRIGIIVFMVPLGFAIASGILVGNYLGAGEPQKAKITAHIGIILASIYGLVTISLLVGLRNFIGLIFTQCKVVVDGVAEVMPILAIMDLFDFIQITCNGTFRGCGKQKTGAWIRIVGYYIFVLPGGIPVALVTDMKVLGLWTFMTFGMFIMMVLSLIVVFRFDWIKLSHKAQVRVGAKPAISEDGQEIFELNSISVEDEEVRLKDGQDEEQDGSATVESTLQTSPEVSEASLDTEFLLSDDEAHCTKPTLARRYSQRPTSRLLFKRLVYVLVCCAVMVAGILVRELVPLDSLRGSSSNSTLHESCPSEDTYSTANASTASLFPSSTPITS